MPDISQPGSVKVVERRTDGRSQGKPAATGAPPQKIVATYEEVARTKPSDDRITILGIPVEQITPVTQAALGALVGEINYLRNLVKRHERPRKGDLHAGATTEILEPEAFLRALGSALAKPALPGTAWVLVLVHVATYEDIRRSSGLLAANSALADVAQRLKDLRLTLPAAEGVRLADHGGATLGEAAASLPLGFSLIGYAGGSNLAALSMVPTGQDTDAIARAVRERVTANGYLVGGIDMALAVKTAAAVIGDGESAALALGRADHILRSA